MFCFEIDIFKFIYKLKSNMYLFLLYCYKVFCYIRKLFFVNIFLVKFEYLIYILKILI